jgi:hypothetical protein
MAHEDENARTVGLGLVAPAARPRGRITDRPGDDALARLMVDEYVKFPA